jgi:hypothetical protein
MTDKGMLLIEHVMWFEALSVSRPDDRSHGGVRARRPDGSGDGIDTDALGTSLEVAAVDCIAITLEMA